MNNIKNIINIYEPQYTQNKYIKNTGATPFIFDNVHPEWREFYLFTELFKSLNWVNSTYSGIVSPKFCLKTKVTIKEFKKFVIQNPGFDVYFVNPFPQMAYFNYNIWDHGEIFHPGIINLSQKLLNAVGIPWRLDDVARTSYDLLCYCNYWVGNEKFWIKYVGNILNPIRLFIENNKDPELIRELFSLTIHTNPTPMFPFIIERLFTTFLYFSQEIKYIHYPTENRVETYCLNEFEKQIVSFVKSSVDQMDRDEFFDDAARALMRGLGFSLQQFTLEYYSRRSYPYTGENIETSK
jgi:hypothetical protein